MSRWFRMYDDVINDPKVMRLPEATRWHWVTVLCAASKHGKDDGMLPATGELAFLLRLTEQRVAVILTELVSAGLVDKVDGGFAPHNWRGRQYKSDVSTDRVKRFRERQSNGKRNVSPDVSETPPEAETEQKQSRAEAPRGQIDLVEKALCDDLQEIFGPDIDLSRAGVWIEKGYDPGMVREVIRELRRRKPDIASLAYFDAALAERHAKRPATPSERAAAAAAVDWDKVIAMYARCSVWSRYAGPAPGLSGCRAPVELLAKHGVDAASGQTIRKAG